MEVEWVNNGEPDENGDITVHIKNSVGNRISTYKGKNEKEILDQAIRSNMESIRTINRLKKPDTGRPGTKIERKAITESDRTRYAMEITDPDRVVETITEIVTKEQGISPAAVGHKLSIEEEAANAKYIQRESWAFRNANPDYYPVPQNMDALLDVLKANNWPISRTNLQIAYQTLLDQETLIQWPSEEEKQNEITILEMNRQQQRPQETETPNGTTQPSTPTSRPRNTSIATGIRNSDVSGTAPTPAPKRPKYTRVDIETMSRADYEFKLKNEPGFRAFVDAMMTTA